MAEGTWRTLRDGCKLYQREQAKHLFQRGKNSVLEHQSEIQQQAMELCKLLIDKLNPLYTQYEENGSQNSALFAFWNEYV